MAIKMYKIPENKTRKRLRITLCIFYLFQLVLCAWPYYQFIDGDTLISNSVFEMLSALGTGNVDSIPSSEFSAITTILPVNFIFVIIPIVGFFFCALDKERNLKNIVSFICCLTGVVSILTVVTVNLISLGSLLALLLYVLIAFVTSFSMLARIADSQKSKQQ